MDELLRPLHSAPSEQSALNPSPPSQQERQSSSLREQDPAIVEAKCTTLPSCHSVPDSATSTTSSPPLEPFPDIDPFLLHCSFLSDDKPLPLPYIVPVDPQPYPNALTYRVSPPTLQATSSSSSDQAPRDRDQARVVVCPQPCPSTMIPAGWPYPGVDMSHLNSNPLLISPDVYPITGNHEASNDFQDGPSGGPNVHFTGQQHHVAAGQTRPTGGNGNPQSGPWRRRDPALDWKGYRGTFDGNHIHLTSLDKVEPSGSPAGHHFTSASNSAVTLPTEPTSNKPAPYDFHYTPKKGLQPFPTPAEVQAKWQARGKLREQADGREMENKAENNKGHGKTASNATTTTTAITTNPQAMTSPTSGSPPVPVKQQQQAPAKSQHRHFHQHQHHHHHQSTTSGIVAVNQVYPFSQVVPAHGAKFEEQGNRLIDNHPPGRLIEQPPPGHLIEKPPVLQIQLSQLARSQDWAEMYRFNAKSVPPFVDLTRNVAPSEKPVICIKNIPYTITQNEIQQFLGKSLLPHSLTYLSGPGTASLPIYIIMERGTGKTQDCFVELPSESIAADCIERVENLTMANKPPKIAQRIVSVELSNQGELMRQIFPRAKNILWDPTTGIPIMLAPVDGYGAGFRGFLTGEEMNNVVRYAVMPQRSPFVVRCQQRTYEMTIATLIKFPWASIYYTLEDRDCLFNAYINQLTALLPKVLVEEYGNSRSQRVVGLDPRLVASFVDAGMNCPGFNEAQKAKILDHTNQNYAYRGVSQYGSVWPFNALSKPDGVGDYDIALWVELMRVGATSALSKDIVLAVGQDGIHYVEVAFDEWGQLMMNVSEEGRKSVAFADLARMEQKLMKCMLLHGWEICLSDHSALPMLTDDNLGLSKVEEKMKDLGVFELGIDLAAKFNDYDVAEPATNQGKEMETGITNSNHDANQAQGQTIRFEDPFMGRRKSIASDSGFGGMHRTVDMNVLLREVNEMAKDVNTGGLPRPAETARPNYASALGNILANTEKANAPAKTDGQVLNAAPSNATASNPLTSSPEGANGGQAHPFSTPHRRISNAGTDISPRTRASSYVVKTTPRAEKSLDPVGTPSRRSMQGNTVSIGDTIDEDDESDDDSVVMQGRRTLGGA